MRLFKRIVFYVFIAAALMAAIWGYFRLKQSKEPVEQVEEHISNQALCVISSENTHDFIGILTRQNLIWKSLLTESTIQKAHHSLVFLDSLFNSNSEVVAAMDGSMIYSAFFKNQERVDNLIIFKMKEENDADIFESFFKAHLSKSSSVSSLDAFELIMNKETWLVSINQGLIYLSNRYTVLEEAVHLPKSNSIAQNPGYLKLIRNDGEQKNRMYYNHRLGSLFDRSLFNEQSLFNIDLQLNSITCNGYTKANSSSFFHLLNQQKAAYLTQFMLLPDKAVSVIAISLSQPQQFYKNFITNYPQSKSQKIIKGWQNLNDSAMYDIHKEFLENIDLEITSANYWLNDTASTISAFKIHDSEKAKNLFQILGDTIIQTNQLQVIKLPASCRYLFSFFNIDLSNQYVAFDEEKIVLFSNIQGLNYYLTCLSSSNFLQKNTGFMNFTKENLSSESNFIYYENSQAIRHTSFSSILNAPEINSGDEVLSELSLNVKQVKDLFQFRLNASHAKQENTIQLNTNALWAFNADTTIQSPVYVFKNHLSGENELCFQDIAHQFYLLNSTGSILWHKKLNESLRSKVYTVDIFKNGKLQLLFNTDNYIHLLDRNGNYVQGYPVKVPAKITSPLTVLDYDKTKDYRLFIACEDKKIYNYSIYGIKAEGFIPLKTEAIVTLPVKYLKMGLSDYLVTMDVKGKPYVFSRKGEGRIDFKNKLAEHVHSLYVLSGTNLDNTKIVCFDNTNNNIKKLSFSDKLESLKIGDEVYGFDAEFDLMNDDQQEDVLVYGSGAVYAYDLFSNQIYQSFNSQAVYANAQIINTSDHQWVLALDRAGQKLEILDKEGKASMIINYVTQVPLAVRLYNNEKTYLILPSHKTISCQELN